MPKKMEKKKKNLTSAFNGNAMLGLGCSQEHPDLKTKILKKKKKKKKKEKPTNQNPMRIRVRRLKSTKIKN